MSFYLEPKVIEAHDSKLQSHFYLKPKVTGTFDFKTDFYSDIIPDKFLDHILFTDESGTVRTINCVTHFEKKLYRKIKIGYSPIIEIVGQQGTGKSHLALFMALLHASVFNKPFDFKKNSFYEILAALKNIDKTYQEPQIIDEAGALLNPKEWYEKSHIAINSMLQTQRFRRNLYIFVSPFACDIDASITKHFDFQLHVTEHGRFKAFKFHKRFREKKQINASFPIFLDDCSLKMDAVPKNIFDAYTKYSEMKKDEINKNKVRQMENEEARNDYIYNYIKKVKAGYG
jgi:hypothetical protein